MLQICISQLKKFITVLTCYIDIRNGIWSVITSSGAIFRHFHSQNFGGPGLISSTEYLLVYFFKNDNDNIDNREVVLISLLEYTCFASSVTHFIYNIVLEHRTCLQFLSLKLECQFAVMYTYINVCYVQIVQIIALIITTDNDTLISAMPDSIHRLATDCNAVIFSF